MSSSVSFQAITKAINKNSTALQVGVFLILLSFGVLIVGYIFFIDIESGHDDAYISYVYAKNFAHGDGLVFNKGEKVWGYTSPAQVLLLGILTIIGFETSKISTVCGVLFIVLSAFIIYKIISSFFHPIFGVLISLHFVFNPIGQYAFLDLETNLLLFTQLLFLYFILNKKHKIACLVAAISCLVRPDSIVFVLPIMLLEWECLRIKNLLYFIIPGIAWMIFSSLYYNDIFPNTYYAKKQLSSFAEYFSQTFMWVFFYDKIQHFPGEKTIAILVGFIFSIMSVVKLKIQQHKSLIFAIICYPWILLVSYGVIGAPEQQIWQTFSARFFYWFSIMFGLVTFIYIISNIITTKLFKRHSAKYIFTAIFLLLYLFIIIFPDANATFSYLKSEERLFWKGRRHRTYMKISEWMNKYIPENETLALGEAGTIGYYTKLHLIDLNGLITKIYVNGKKLKFHEVLRKYKPTYVLMSGVHKYLRVTKTQRYKKIKYFKKEGYDDFSLMMRIQ